MDRVGFEPTTSAMPMPYPTRLDDRPSSDLFFIILHINICYTQARKPRILLKIISFCLYRHKIILYPRFNHWYLLFFSVDSNNINEII
jgi:hypothetical protein